MSRTAAIITAALLTTAGTRADEAAEQLVRATYKLAGEGSTATGLCVFRREGEEKTLRRYIVTAHHVLEQMGGDAFTLVGREAKADGTYGRLEIEVPLRAAGEPLWEKHAEEDLAVLPLPGSAEIEALSIDSVATGEQLRAVHTGDLVQSAVFPERSEANGAGFPLLRGGWISSFPLVPVAAHPMFLVHTTTWPGDSGGPVMHGTRRAAGGRPLVIGIVRGMRSITDKEKASRYVKTETSYPLDIAEVLHIAPVHEMLAGGE